MDTISASDAKNQFSALLDKVQTEPVIISKHGRPVAVMMSASEFDAHVSFKAEIAGEQRRRAEKERDTRVVVFAA